MTDPKPEGEAVGLPCPHCGGNVKCFQRPASASWNKEWVAFCDTTDCTHGFMRDTKAEAIAAWNRRTPPAPADHGALIDQVRAIAREYGWAIAVHGTLKRDIDLVAAPWTEDACMWLDLHLAIGKRLGYERGNIENKPHGRIGAILFERVATNDGNGNFTPPQLDISYLTPPAPARHDGEAVSAEEVERVAEAAHRGMYGEPLARSLPAMQKLIREMAKAAIAALNRSGEGT